MNMFLKLLPFVLFSPMVSQAALFIYEGFDYGTGGAINGTAATGTGLTGSYNTSANGTGGAATLTTGLGFSDRFFATSGGALQLSVTSASPTTNENAVAGVRLNAGVQTGTVYASYLFNLSSNSINNSGDSIGTWLSDTQNGNNNRRLGMHGDSGNSGDSVAVTYGNSTSSQTGTAGTTVLSLGTTYLMIGQWNNVGDAGGGTSTMWFLTAGQYDDWLDAGASLVALDFHATGKTSRTQNTQVLLDNDTYLQFSIGEGGNDTTGTLAGVFDELRFGTDLASVTVIPEPSSFALLVSGAALLGAGFRRGRRTSRLG